MSWGNAVILDPIAGVAIVNETEIDDHEVMTELVKQHPRLSSEMGMELATMTRWVSNTRRPVRPGIFERDQYVTPVGIYEQMRTAQHAAEHDNVVSGVAETTEALALSRMAVESLDLDETDIWSQIINDLDLDSRFREMWNELFTVSQFYAVTWWGTKTYRVSGRSPKTDVKRKKTFANLRVPVGLTLLDPTKVVPVGNTMFNQEQLCYIANREEGNLISEYLQSNRTDDQIIANMIVGKYDVPNDVERRLLNEMGLSADNQLFLLNPQYVWRHTLTRPQYKRFADVRLKSVFPLLDLKTQLREMDRAHLLGGTNFIVLVKKGEKDAKATPQELSQLQSQVRTMARVPVIVGDHTLEIEIVTPALDNTLDAERHLWIDDRINARLLQTFAPEGKIGSDDSVSIARVVALGMESRRMMLKKTFEKQVLKATFDANDDFKEDPKLVFYPNRIALDFDADMASYMLELRDRGDVSRDTMLNMVDLNQVDEFYKRKMEKDLGFDDVFETQVPFSTPNGGKPSNSGSNPAVNKSAGRNLGGKRSGGGRAPGTGQGKKKESASEEDE